MKLSDPSQRATALSEYGIADIGYVAAAMPHTESPTSHSSPHKGLSAGAIGAIVACSLLAVLAVIIVVVKMNGRKKGGSGSDESAMVDHLNSTMVTRYDTGDE